METAVKKTVSRSFFSFPGLLSDYCRRSVTLHNLGHPIERSKTASPRIRRSFAARMGVFAVGMALLITPDSSRVVAQSAPLKGIDAYVQQAVRDWEVPGLAIVVVKDGELAFA